MKPTSSTQAVAATILLFNSVTVQGEGVLNIEYVPGYERTLGAGYYQFNDNGFGFYGNAQTTLKKRQPMYQNLTVSSFGDPVTGRYKDLNVGDIGITRKISPGVGVYAGLGYATVTGEAQKRDPLQVFGTNGVYYVKDPQNDKSGANLNAGIIMLSQHLSFNIGYHSITKSAYFGIGVRL